MKKNSLKTFTTTIVAVIIMTNYSTGQWATNGNHIYNTNSGNVGFSTTGNHNTPAYLIDAIGDINIDLSLSSASAYRIRGDRILWHNNNTTDIFLGVLAGNNTMSGHLNTLVGNGAATSLSSGNRNTVMGNAAGNKTTTGDRNVFVGDSAGYWNVSGDFLTFVGSMAGFRNTANYGTFVGFETGRENTSGTYNTFIGYTAGLLNTTGTQNTYVGANAGPDQTTASYNSGLGVNSLNDVTTGSRNSALGYGSGYNITTADSNTCVGYRAGAAITTGDRNTFLGYEADASANNLVNASAIGNGAVVCASDEMVFGNTAVTRWGFGVCPASGHAIEVGTSTSNGNGAYLSNTGVWNPGSSRKIKEDFQVQDVNKILDKVRKIEVTKWRYKGGPENEYHYGPMAEDFYQLFEVGDGKSISDMDKTGVLFLAVQALDKRNLLLEEKLQVLGDELNKLKDLINDYGQHTTSLDNNSNRTSIDVALFSKSIVLNQNQPNPFREQTTVAYFIPDDASNVKIIFTDAQGTVLKEVEISEKGQGQLNVYAQDLSSGTYTYTLIADGVTIDSKKMVCTK